MSKMINLEKFADGALTEKFNIALTEVLENIADPNTEENKKRKLTIELTFLPSEDREISFVDIVTKTKLEPKKSAMTTILIDKDGKGGIIASEYRKQIEGQRYIRVDEETGEILEPNDTPVDIKGIKLVR